MEAKAYLKYLRIAPRKVQIVADLIRGKDVNTAMAILMQTPKAASEPMIKLLKSAVANAENNHDMDVEKLYVSQVFATPGPILKRVMPRAQGRAYRINKRTSHVKITRCFCYHFLGAVCDCERFPLFFYFVKFDLFFDIHFTLLFS